MRKTAFTLAETLITIGIIGIVAAITIPTLINQYQRIAFPIQLKSLYSKLLVAQKTLNNEYGTPEYWDLTNYATDQSIGDVKNLEFFNRYAELLGAISTETRNSLSNSKKYSNVGITQYYRLLNGETVGEYDGIYRTGNAMLLKNAQSVAIIFANNTNGGVKWDIIKAGYIARIVVDVNGLGKPNMLGRDIFVFGLKSGSNSIVPYSKDTTDCVKGGEGMSCSKKIIDENWKMNY
jgi:type II secretory pathway pseudopilin PulG